jgi:Spy/CpxP family protein refolding chaperone
MHGKVALGVFVLTLGMVLPVAAAEPPALSPATREELGRAFDELAEQLRGLEEQWRAYFHPNEPRSERPLISIMLGHRQELGLTPAQVQELERLRADFQREAIKRDADLRVAEMDLQALLKADPVDLTTVEGKIREIERLRADLRIARIRAIEQGRAQLTPGQRAKLADLLARPWAHYPWGSTRPGPPASPQRF